MTEQSINTWYKDLIRAPGTPPNIVFPIVWTILYVLMAISLSLFISSPSRNKTGGYLFFALQLILNFSWSLLFFGMKSPFFALIDIILLWLCILGTILIFKKHSKLSAYLLLPYLVWVGYAFYLNLFIWLNNP